MKKMKPLCDVIECSKVGQEANTHFPYNMLEKNVEENS